MGLVWATDGTQTAAQNPVTAGHHNRFAGFCQFLQDLEFLVSVCMFAVHHDKPLDAAAIAFRNFVIKQNQRNTVLCSDPACRFLYWRTKVSCYRYQICVH